MQSICVCCATEHPELSHTSWKTFMGLLWFLFSFLFHFESLAFFILFSHPEMVRVVGVDNLNAARMNFMLHILYSYTVPS